MLFKTPKHVQHKKHSKPYVIFIPNSKERKKCNLNFIFLELKNCKRVFKFKFDIIIAV